MKSNPITPNYNAERLIIFISLMAIVSCNSKPKETTFIKHVITSEFISEGIAVGDVNRDGFMDILAGSFWFEGPNWIRHNIDTPRIFEVIEGKLETLEASYSNSMLNHAMDVNSDGWIDFIRIDFPGTAAYWYENPGNSTTLWKRHTIFHAVGNESPRFVDVDGDGKIDILCGDAETNQMIWLKSPSEQDSVRWKKFFISQDSVPGTKRFAHGLGFFDINGDGRKDVIIPEGWWEAPENPKQYNWTFHPANLGQPCAQMEGIDLDGDGDIDVVTSSAHNRGIWWHEQMDDGAWQEHVISKEFSQTHALILTDLNRNKQPDFITGKRYLASRGNGDGAHEPSVLLWIEYFKDTDQPWKIHQIDNDSGVGLHIVIEDMNGDGLPDILTANKKGVFYFQQTN
jgi:hypothetical protein